MLVALLLACHHTPDPAAMEPSGYWPSTAPARLRVLRRGDQPRFARYGECPVERCILRLFVERDGTLVHVQPLACRDEVAERVARGLREWTFAPPEVPDVGRGRVSANLEILVCPEAIDVGSTTTRTSLDPHRLPVRGL